MYCFLYITFLVNIQLTPEINMFLISSAYLKLVLKVEEKMLLDQMLESRHVKMPKASDISWLVLSFLTTVSWFVP